jgi:hypothetical protein
MDHVWIAARCRHNPGNGQPALLMAVSQDEWRRNQAAADNFQRSA